MVYYKLYIPQRRFLCSKYKRKKITSNIAWEYFANIALWNIDIVLGKNLSKEQGFNIHLILQSDQMRKLTKAQYRKMNLKKRTL